MKAFNKYIPLVAMLADKGVNFETDVFCRDRSIDWDALAKEYGYKKPTAAYLSRGGCFYALLQKAYAQMKKRGTNENKTRQ